MKVSRKWLYAQILSPQVVSKLKCMVHDHNVVLTYARFRYGKGDIRAVANAIALSLGVSIYD